MAKIGLIGDKISVLGFRLAGIKKSYIVNKENVDEMFKKVETESDIIIITAGLFNALKKKESDKIIIQIPDKEISDIDIIKTLVKDVIGFEIKI